MAKQIKKHGKKVLIFALLILLVGTYLAIPIGQAAQMDPRQTKISDSRPDAPATSVTYDFQGTTSGTTVMCLRMRICDSADTGSACTTPTGLSTTSAAIGDSGDWNLWTQASWTGDFAANGDIKYTYAAGEAGGSNASFSTNSITNPTSTGTYYAWINTYTDVDCSTGPTDDGVTVFAIVSGVAVTATVTESLSVTISSVASGSCTADTGTVTVKSTSAGNAVPLGILTVDEFNAACHEIEVTTNAADGYSLTSQETTSMKKTPDIIDDTTCQSGTPCDQTTASAWTDADGYPGLGHSCEQVTGTPCNTAYDWTANKKYRQFACVGSSGDCNPGSGGETAIEMMADSGAGTTKGKVHYKMGITGTEVAGDYSNTVIYITTPTY